MEDIDTIYEKTFGKDSAYFLGKLWLIMIAKHMDEVRKSEDDAYEFMGESLLKWLNKLRVLYDNVEFKTDIPLYKEEKTGFLSLKFNEETQKYEELKTQVLKKELYLKWFGKIQQMWESMNRLANLPQTDKIKLKKSQNILLELGACQRSLYMEIEKRHLIMPPGKEDMKDLAKKEWVDREYKKDFDGSLQ